ncbi:MAG: UDP-N-acetylmuramoyl-L-alanine--D-glutamate ligase [Lachnospiraceae bacterium]|nr:UDP-N-acetylmuramoyl-L-alanine--D-glutamate ligase [Lachnospiraceae bacterium]
MKKSVLVAGCGISGIGAAKLLLGAGESVILYDGNKQRDAEELRRKVGTEGELEIVLGDLTDEVISRVSFCVISPGIPTDVPFALQLKAAGIALWSEIELAYRYGKGTVIGITGTNGKTTTTSLTGAIMAAHFGSERTFVVGNIGTPYTERAMLMKDDSVTVAEISSFQLETAITFHPHVSAVLNVTPDHLDRHKTMECYTQVKESISANQTADDFCVLNYDDPALRAFGAVCPAKVVYFSSREQLEEGFCMDGTKLVYRHDKEEEVIGSVDEFHLVGRCNYENILAASAIGISMGVPMETVSRVAKAFLAVEHRIEYTVTKNGVRYYNDSKGTNPDAAIQGIRAMTTPTCLIGGGYDKGSEYDDWVKEFGTTVKYLVLIGQTKEKIAQCCRTYGFTNYEFAESMEEAVNKCAAHALPGEAVLLSPACASWGMFDNYEQRGRIFKELARNLPEA